MASTSNAAGQANGNEQELKIDYLHGSSDMGMFDYFGPVLVGFFVFFFVFLIAGVSFLRERQQARWNVYLQVHFANGKLSSAM